MKKFLFILFLVALLLITSISSVAVSNVYSFSADWNKIVFDLASISNSTSVVDPSIVIAPGLSYKLKDNDDYVSFGSDLLFVGTEYSGRSDSSFIVDIPVNLRITNEDTLTWSMWLLINDSLSDVSVSAFGVTPDGSYVTIDVASQVYDFARLQTYTLNSFGGVESIETVYAGNTVQNLLLSYDNNASQRLDRIQLVITTSSATDSFVVGALGSQNLVSVPSDVYQLLLDISNKTGLTNSRILAMLTDIRSMADVLNEINVSSADTSNAIYGLIEQLDSVISSLGSSASISQQINNYISMPSEQQQIVTDQLTELVSSAKEQLSEIKEVINSVLVPTTNDLITSNDDGYDNALNIIEGELTQNLFSSIFTKLDFLTGLILTVLAIATLGYVLFGKKA